eukprot:CAMPEP_0196754422 /NCGR_PEP_ID=MMETSP1091-20130531/93865_1 /TAXON_ID=302021 /ORGANISM="Rhodomonas sp., Strain CCMP768" /LENGTH=100 /DNA_ID=CAMNT_0042102679 /DNA_START=27 /DNA_END=326 /DNA_ORIENTATION=+
MVLGARTDDTESVRTNDKEEEGERAVSQVAAMMAMAERMVRHASTVKVTLGGAEQSIRVRVGVSSGAVHSAMVGIKTSAFSVFGPAVREAAMAAQRGVAG